MADTQTCTLNRSWTMKMVIFMAVLLGFGTWALYDAVSLYPKRGLAAASVKFTDYLVAADKAGRLTTERLTVTDPAGERSKLKARESDLRAAARSDSTDARAAAMDLAKLEWLDALATSWKLNTDIKPLGEIKTPARKSYTFDMTKGEGIATTPAGEKTTLSPQALLNDMTALWASTNRPTPLVSYDLPVQWIFMVLGYGGGLYLLYLIVKCKSAAAKHAFEPAAQRLTLASGASFTPADIEDIDKRLWHKYYVTVITKDNAHHKLDLLRYVPLEEWILAMERTRFPERAAEAEAAAQAAAQTGNSETQTPNT